MVGYYAKCSSSNYNSWSIEIAGVFWALGGYWVGLTP